MIFGVKTVFLMATTVWLAASLFPPAQGFSQQRKTASGEDDLLRKIGVSRIAKGSAAADFSLRDVSGNAFSLSGYRGSLVFLNFWATWCGPCRREMPSMERLYNQLSGQGLVMLAINQKENAQQVANFIRTHRLTFPAPLDVDGRVSSLYRVWGLPTTYLIDGNGLIIGMKSGPKDWASREVVDTFANLLGGSEIFRRGLASFEGIGANAPPLPSALIVKSTGASLHQQQDPQSEVIAKLSQGEQVFPFANSSAGAEVWYMVKTKAGAMGWIQATEVDEIPKAK